MGCVSQDSDLRSRFYERRKMEIKTRRQIVRKSTWHKIRISERKGQSRGINHKCEPHERSPCAPKFGERSHEDTLHKKDAPAELDGFGKGARIRSRFKSINGGQRSKTTADERREDNCAKRTTSYLLLFQGCPPVLGAIRRQHRHRKICLPQVQLSEVTNQLRGSSPCLNFPRAVELCVVIYTREALALYTIPSRTISLSAAPVKEHNGTVRIFLKYSVRSRPTSGMSC